MKIMIISCKLNYKLNVKMTSYHSKTLVIASFLVDFFKKKNGIGHPRCLLNSPAGTQLFEFYLRKKHQVTKRSFNQLFFPLSWVLTLVSRVNESYSIWNDEFDLFTDEMTHFRYNRYVKLRHFWLVLNEMNHFRGSSELKLK